VAAAINNADSAEIPAAAVELGAGGMFLSLFPDGIALGAKVKAAVEVKTSVLEINTTVEVNTAVEVNATIKPVFSEKHSCQCLRERMSRRMIWWDHRCGRMRKRLVARQRG
jgi:hypothetical protein